MAASTVERAERWREELGRAFGRLEPEAYDVRGAAGDHGLDGAMAAAPLGRTGVFSVRGTPQVVRRTPRAIAVAPLDPLKVCIQLAGSVVIHQGDREVLLEPGQLSLYDTGRPYALRLAGPWACAVVTVPRDAVTVADSALDAAMRRPFPVSDGPGALLSGLTDYALHHLGEAAGDDAGRAHLGEAGIQLVATLLDTVATDPAPDEDPGREAVLAYVRAHLRDPGLSHASVAAAHHMSPRTLHRLFEDRDRSVTDTIRRLRLDAVRAELQDPRWRRSPIMAVAARWGFRDQGHLTRAFRSAYGETPGAVRRAGPSD